MKKIVYLAGAMSGVPKEFYEGWREYVDDFFTYYYNWEVFDPTKYFTDKTVSEDKAMISDLSWLRKSDVVIANFNYNPQSVGTACEVAIANTIGIPVVGYICGIDEFRNLHPWLSRFCQRFFLGVDRDDFSQMDDLLNYVVKNI